MKAFKFGEKQVLISNINGVYYAISSVCTHMGGDLSKGKLEGSTVICPRHKAKFDVTTGAVVSPPSVLFMHPKINAEPAYPVKVEGKDILIDQE
jgi:3-phenylpropionate/trans-cinnamate dioxygenase ferredoxin subunit